VRLARRFGKKQAWIAAMARNTGAFLPVYLLGPGDTTAYALLVALSGVGFGATLALPSAMQADVIDYEELRSGERGEGQVLGLWSVVRKLSAALGVGLALPLLDAAGYVPGARPAPEVQRSLAALYALVPSLCTLAGLAIALASPLGRAEHEAVLAAIEARRAGRSASDPLIAPTTAS
jgi:GPH family glycoside/pentoside/hexuronide:cation symporter